MGKKKVYMTFEILKYSERKIYKIYRINIQQYVIGICILNLHNVRKIK